MGDVTVMPRDGDWTVDDLDALPDDGLQYELADGVLLVTPGPVLRHQSVIGELYHLLRQGCPSELQVFLSPLDFRPTNRRSLQPDLLVVPRQDMAAKSITQPLLLAVEVLSPSTRSKDLLLKRGLYEDSGVPSYWVVDPDEPSVTVLELVDGRYEEVGRAVGSERLEVQLPFPVELQPDLLLG